ncbi:hypothetical protein [Brevundimonas sp.]|uniref:hypothetical protein n=1 Tax=Brevundimonas sp. TaxID=1871086 RepID=UPI002D6F3588|nr:hypothetical protein [Brevundimonas sp.]HYC68045.1 hypothetical protein [Brevundimonas sp.]
MRIHRFAAAFVAVALFAPTAMAQSASIDFTLNNETDHVLTRLFISLPSTDNWEEDILGEDVLGAGESIEISIDDGLPECVYDIRADFDDGDSVQVARVNFCELDGEELTVGE